MGGTPSAGAPIRRPGHAEETGEKYGLVIGAPIETPVRLFAVFNQLPQIDRLAVKISLLQVTAEIEQQAGLFGLLNTFSNHFNTQVLRDVDYVCLLYTSDAADE